MTIELTDEMINAIRAFVPAPCSRDAAKRAAEAMLTIVERDYLLEICGDELAPGIRCGYRKHFTTTPHQTFTSKGTVVTWE